MTLAELSLRVRTWRESKKFFTPNSIDNETFPTTLVVIGNGDLMLGKLMLVVSEVAEAAEAVRKNDMINFIEEIADTFIRLLDICGTMSIPIENIIEDKLKILEERPERHGKFTIL